MTEPQTDLPALVLGSGTKWYVSEELRHEIEDSYDEEPRKA
jgi:hypothetical protein